MSDTKVTVLEDKKSLVIEREFNASRDKVWAAWTQPELIMQWWGPIGWETEIKHMDFSEGGYQHYGMKCVDPAQTDWYGKYSWGKMTYHDIVPQESFSYVDAFCDEKAVVTPGMPTSETVQTFTEHDGKTTMVSTTTYDKPQDLQQVLEMGMEEGMKQTLDRLDAFVGRE